MFEQALEIAKEYDGYIVGSYAIRGLIPDFPAERVDVLILRSHNILDVYRDRLVHDKYILCLDIYFDVLQIRDTSVNIIVPASQAPLYILTIKSFIDAADLAIEKCWYDKDGRFHARPEARTAASDRRMVYLGGDLDRVNKYNAVGFSVRMERPLSANTTVYNSRSHGWATHMPFGRIIFRGINVTTDFLQQFKRARKLEFDGCTFINVTVERMVDMTFMGCVGQLNASTSSIELLPAKNPYLLINDIYTPFDDEWQHSMYMLKIQFLAGLPDVSFMDTIDIMEYLNLTVFRIDAKTSDALILLMSKHKRFASRMELDMWERHIRPPYPIGITVPSEWIHDIRFLIRLTELGCTAPRYTRSTLYVHADPSDRITVDVGNPRLLRNDIPSLVSAINRSQSKFRHAVFRSVHQVQHGDYSDVLVMALDIDGIMMISIEMVSRQK